MSHWIVQEKDKTVSEVEEEVEASNTYEEPTIASTNMRRGRTASADLKQELWAEEKGSRKGG